MAKTYRVLVKSFINNGIREEGDIVEYDGKPGSNLELVTDEKPQRPKGKNEEGKSTDSN